MKRKLILGKWVFIVTSSVFLFGIFGIFFVSAAKIPVKIDGSYSTEQGQVSYSVPIQVPPAFSNIQPSLSLNYSSSYGNTFIAHGWKISGLSNVNLCGLNYFSDKTWSSVSTDNPQVSDLNRFCLNGQRLVNIKGEYGADGTEYRTEIFNKMRIISHGVCYQGPCSFEVFSPDGNKSVYGTEGNSIIQPSGKSILVWSINEESDRHGNKIQYTYMNIPQDNMLYPQSIDYVSNSDQKLLSQRSVKFEYSDSTLKKLQKSFLSLTGATRSISKTLTNITTYLDGKIILSYQLDKKLNSFSNKELLKSISLCDSNSSSLADNCFASTEFSYENENQTEPENIIFDALPSVSLSGISSDPDKLRIFIMDKYGDGYPGMAVVSADNNNETRFNYFRNQSGSGQLVKAEDSFSLGKWSADPSKPKYPYKYFILDKNGDSLSDLVKIYNDNSGGTYAQTYINSRGKTNFTPEKSVQFLDNGYPAPGTLGISYVSKDVNGDGLFDLVRMDSTVSSDKKYTVKVFYSVKGMEGFPQSEVLDDQIEAYAHPKQEDAISFVDMTGDSYHDIHVATRDSGDEKNFNVLGIPLYHIGSKFQGASSRSAAVKMGSNNDWEEMPAHHIFDYNNDSLSDILWINYFEGKPATAQVWINTGKFDAESLIPPSKSDNLTSEFVIGNFDKENKGLYRNLVLTDANGDGRNDILKYFTSEKDPKDASNTYFEIYSNTGSGFKLLSKTQTFGAHTRNLPVDLNGDGVIDILSVNTSVSNEVKLIPFINKSQRIDHKLSSVTNGVGYKLTFEYEQLSKLHAIDTANLPDYPYIVYNQPRRVLSGYTKTNLDGFSTSSYAYNRSFSFHYKNGVYNQQNLGFNGFQEVTMVDKARNLSQVKTYSIDYPLYGKLKSTESYNLDSGQLIDGYYTEFVSKVIYPNSKKNNVKGVDDMKVYLINHKTSQTKVYYQDSSNKTLVVSNNVKKFNYADISEPDGLYGNVTSVEAYVEGSSSSLYTCYIYLNLDDDKSWAIGLIKGKKESTSEGCDDFQDVSKYVWKKGEDLRLSAMDYDSDNLTVNWSRSYYYDTDKDSLSGWVGAKYTYNPLGLILTVQGSSSYLPLLDSEYGTKDIIYTLTKNYDSYGFLQSKNYTSSDTKEIVATLYQYDPRFGSILQTTNDNGYVLKSEINPLGLATNQYMSNPAKVSELIKMSDVTYQADSDNSGSYYRMIRNRVDWSDSKESNWLYKKEYYDGLHVNYKSIKKGSEGKDIVGKEIYVYPTTGRKHKEALVYFEGDTPNLVEHIYNDIGKIKQIIQANGSSQSFAYTYGDNTLQVDMTSPDPSMICTQTDPKTIVTTRILNFKDRKNTVIKIDTSQTQTFFNLLGEQTKFIDERNLIVSNEYDSLGRLRKTSNPDGGDSSTNYDAVSHPHLQTLSDSTEISFQYSGLGRIKNKQAKNGTQTDSISYNYGEEKVGFYNKGKLTSIDYEDLTYNYDHNIIGEITTQTVSIDELKSKYNKGVFVFEYEFSPLGRTKMLQYPDSTSLSLDYFGSHQLKEITYLGASSSKSSIVQFSDYNPFGTARTVQKNNGSIQIKNEDDILGRIKSTTATASSSTFFDYSYCYNSAGLLTQEKDGAKIEKFSYNSLGQIKGASASHYGQLDYNYDISGNITKNRSATYEIKPNSNHMNSSQSGSIATTYDYAETGGLSRKTTKKAEGVESISYTYNPSGRLSEYFSPLVSVQNKYAGNEKIIQRIKTKDDLITKYKLSSGLFEITVKGEKQDQITIAKRVFWQGFSLAYIYEDSPVNITKAVK